MMPLKAGIGRGGGVCFLLWCANITLLAHLSRVSLCRGSKKKRATLGGRFENCLSSIPKAHPMQAHGPSTEEPRAILEAQKSPKSLRDTGNTGRRCSS